MGKRNIELFSGLLMLFAMMVFFVYETEMSIANEYIALLPSVLFIVIGINGVQHTRGGAPTLGAFIMLGVGFALLAATANNEGERFAP